MVNVALGFAMWHHLAASMQAALTSQTLSQSIFLLQGGVYSTVTAPGLLSAGAVFQPGVRTQRAGDAWRPAFLGEAVGRTRDQHAEWENVGPASLRGFLLRCKGGGPIRSAELCDGNSVDSESEEHSASNREMRHAPNAPPSPRVPDSDVAGTERVNDVHDRARRATVQWHEAARNIQEHGGRMREHAMARKREEFLEMKRRGSGPEDGAGLQFGSVHHVSTFHRSAFCDSMRDFFGALKSATSADSSENSSGASNRRPNMQTADKTYLKTT